MDVYSSIFEDGGDALPEEFKTMSAEDIVRRTRLLDNDIRVLKDDSTRLSLEHSGLKEKVWFWIILIDKTSVCIFCYEWYVADQAWQQPDVYSHRASCMLNSFPRLLQLFQGLRECEIPHLQICQA